MDIREIQAVLPHRYPFLFIDRVASIDDDRIVAHKLVSRNEPHFEGHFPGNPVMPGVLIIEALAQAGALLAARLTGFDPAKQIMYFMGMEAVKFRRPVVPGDVLQLEVVPLRRGARSGSCVGRPRSAIRWWPRPSCWPGSARCRRLPAPPPRPAPAEPKREARAPGAAEAVMLLDVAPMASRRFLLVLALLPLVGSGGCRRSRPALSRGDASVVLLAPPVPLPPGMTAVTEQEPSAPGAPPMVLPLAGSPGLAVVGTLAPGPGQPPDAEDLYALEMPGGVLPPDGAVPTDARPPDAAPAPSNRALAIELTPAPGLATVLELRTAAGAVLGTSTGAAGAHHGLPNISVRPGERYLIAVRLARPRKNAPPAPPPAQPATYVLAVRETSLGAGDEREPNDTPETATALPPAHAAPEIAGYFGTAADRDFYRVPIGETSEATLVSVFSRRRPR
jgi:beta-hydroxyacyl-ACP dehydratase FabZ